MGLKRLETIFMKKRKTEEPKNELFCIEGTTLRLYLYIYQLYQVLTTNAPIVIRVEESKIQILYLLIFLFLYTSFYYFGITCGSIENG